MPTNVIFKLRNIRVPSLAHLDDRLLADIGASRDGLPARRPRPTRQASGLARLFDVLMRPLARAVTAV
jgi:hypothetical protein